MITVHVIRDGEEITYRQMQCIPRVGDSVVIDEINYLVLAVRHILKREIRIEVEVERYSNFIPNNGLT